jgi:anti-sigma factor ChrR (cupin superfamily)
VRHLEDILAAEAQAAHLAECGECRDQVERWAELGLAAPEAAPSGEVWRRIEASLQPGRFAAVVDRLARFFDLGRDRARVLLDRLDSRWLDGPSPGIWISHVKAGPRLAGCYAGFFRLAPGVPFPAHRHLGPESMLVLEGSVRVGSGEIVRDGEVLESAPGSVHDFMVAGDDDCIAAVLQEGGLELGVKL